MLAETLGAAIVGVDGLPVRVEVDVAFGLPALTIVGLAGSQVQEARERVRSAAAQQRLRGARAANHDQPVAGGPAQGRHRL